MSVPYSIASAPVSDRFKLLSLGCELKDGPAVTAAAKEKEAKKGGAQQAAAERKIILIENGGLNDPNGTYGDLKLICSKYKDERDWRQLSSVGAAANGQWGWFRGRVHSVRNKGKMSFLVLRRGHYSIQVLIEDGVHSMNREACKWVAKVPSESVVDVYGEICKVEQPINSVSQKDIEVKAAKVFVVSLASNSLPFQLEDAAARAPADEKEAKEVITVGQDIRLDNRWLDLRTPANHAIFRLQSRVGQYFRQFFLDRDFIEIHTPKLIGGSSEGGAAIFRLKYFNQPACLAQSPQLYKQMAVTADLMNVFEIGPVFRAEDSNTHRHMCEFTGLDFEMEIKQHYTEITKMLGDLFTYIFEQINTNCKAELAAIHAQYPFEPLKYLKETLVLNFKDAVAMLREAGENIGDFEDFSTPQEKLLGKLVKAKYNTEFYIVDKYPKTARPFYTMPCPEDSRYTNSYDVFLRGEEITSGAQRIHDYNLLKENLVAYGIPLDTIAPYLESFRNGAWPHGGAGIGLERVVMLFLGLDNIRKTSMFPRTPGRLTP